MRDEEAKREKKREKHENKTLKAQLCAIFKQHFRLQHQRIIYGAKEEKKSACVTRFHFECIAMN